MSSWKGGDWDLAWAWDGMGDGSYPPTREDKKNKNKKNLKKNYFLNKIKKDLPHPAPEAIYNMYASVKLHIMPEPDPTMF